MPAKTIEIPVQIDGRVRGTVRINRHAALAAIRALTRTRPELNRYLAGRRILKEFFVPGKVYSVVLE